MNNEILINEVESKKKKSEKVIRLEQTCSTHNWQAKCCTRHVFILPAETLEMSKFLLTTHFAKLIYHTRAIFKTEKLFVYEGIKFNTNYVCKNMAN